MTSYDYIPDSHLDLAEGRHLGVLSTTGPQGHPQSTAVWYLFDGEQVKVSTRTTLQKYRNIVAQPFVALFVNDPANHFRALEIRGEVSIEEDTDLSFFKQVVEAYGQDLNTFPGLRDRRVILSFTPTATSTVGISKQDRAGLK